MTSIIDQAHVVIVGGGVIGTSAAYHLTKAGMTDVLLLERNELGSGASSRSAGCFTHTRSDSSTIKMISRTRETIRELEEALGENLLFHQHGSVRSVFTEQRLQEMRAMETIMRDAGLAVHEIDAQEAATRVPWLNVNNALRTIFVPEDGYTDGAVLTSSYMRAARSLGARVKRGVTVTEIVVEDGCAVGVKTLDGIIRAEWIVCATGVWSVASAHSIGFGFAGAPTRSHYWITAPDGSGATGQPNVQLPDMRAYLRSEVGGMLIGLQEPQSKTYDPLKLEDDMADMNLLEEEYDLDLLFDQANVLKTAIPRIDEWGFSHHLAGLSMYTPDGKFVLGQPDGFEHLVIAGGCCGSGLASSGGFGQSISEIITASSHSIDISIYNPNRFGVVDPTSQAFRDRCAAARSGKSRGNLKSEVILA